MTEQDMIDLLSAMRDLKRRVDDLETQLGEVTTLDIVANVGDLPTSTAYPNQLVLVENEGLFRYDDASGVYVQEL